MVYRGGCIQGLVSWCMYWWLPPSHPPLLRPYSVTSNQDSHHKTSVLYYSCSFFPKEDSSFRFYPRPVRTLCCYKSLLLLLFWLSQNVVVAEKGKWRRCGAYYSVPGTLPSTVIARVVVSYGGRYRDAEKGGELQDDLPHTSEHHHTPYHRHPLLAALLLAIAHCHRRHQPQQVRGSASVCRVRERCAGFAAACPVYGGGIRSAFPSPTSTTPPRWGGDTGHGTHSGSGSISACC